MKSARLAQEQEATRNRAARAATPVRVPLGRGVPERVSESNGTNGRMRDSRAHCRCLTPTGERTAQAYSDPGVEI
jgi:hypothetical protein